MDLTIDEMSDSELWDAFRSGDSEAFSNIYQQNFSTLYNYGRQFLGEREILLDCIQSLFIDIWNSKQNLGPTTSIQFYLFRSLRRRIVQEKKLRMNSLEQGPSKNIEFEFVAPYEEDLMQIEREEERKAFVLKLMDSLSARQREALYLKYQSGLNNEEISQVMSLKIKTVYNLIYNALQVLRVEIQRKHVSISLVLPILSFLS